MRKRCKTAIRAIMLAVLLTMAFYFPAEAEAVLDNEQAVQREEGDETERIFAVEEDVISQDTDMSSWLCEWDESTFTVTLTEYKGADTDVEVPGTVVKDGNVYGVEIMDTVVGTSSYEYLSTGPFFQNNHIRTVSFQDGVRFRNNSMYKAFFECGNLESVTGLPNGVRTMNEAFKNCKNFIYADRLPPGIEEMQNTFKGCTRLSEAPEIPEGVLNLNSAFQGCQNLMSAPKLPESAQDISYMFLNCINLEYGPEIPPNVTNMDGTFAECYQLKAVPDIYSHSLRTANEAFRFCGELQQISIESDSLESVTRTFYSCRSLQKAELSAKSLQDMDRTFQECSSLTEMPVIPQGVQRLYNTFENCISMVKAGDLPDSIRIVSRAFAGCINLVEVPEFNDQVTSLYGAFQDCTSLQKAPVLPKKLYTLAFTFMGCKNLEQAPEIPAEVLVMRSAFEGCTSLEEAPVIPAGVTDLWRTFRGCSSLKKATDIPQSADNISSLFSGCTELTEAPDIPQGVSNISNTFQYCYRLQGEIIIKANPEYYAKCFEKTGLDGNGLTVHYTENVQNIDRILTTRGENNDHVKKGNNINALVVLFDGNGGTVSQNQIMVRLGYAYEILPVAKRTGYEFAGWYTMKSGGSRVAEETIVGTAANHTLYAAWRPCSYKILFQPEGGSLFVKEKTIAYGSAYGSLPVPVRQGYQFAGWFNSRSGGTQITGKSNFRQTGNQNLYARWKEIIYQVQFNSNGGKKKFSGKGVKNGDSYGSLPAPARSGYRFTGWYTAKSRGKKITSQTRVNLNQDQMLYAHWSKVTVGRVNSLKLYNKKKGRMDIAFKGVKGAAGYQILYGSNSSFTKGKKKVYTTKIKKAVTRLKKRKTYYVKVRAYKFDSAGKKIYGKFSSVKKLPIKK